MDTNGNISLHPPGSIREMKCTRSDEELLVQIASGKDRQAFAELFDRYHVKAFKLARYLTRNMADAEEASQEAMLGLWRSAKTFKGGNARGWIMRVVANHSLRVIRQTRKNKQIDNNPRSELLNDANKTSDDDTEQSERQRILYESLKLLSNQQRQIVALYFGCDLSQDEIARRLEMPQRTVSLRLKDALLQLRTRMAGQGCASVALSAGTFWGAFNVAEGPKAEMYQKVFEVLDAQAISGEANVLAERGAIGNSWRVYAAVVFFVALSSGVAFSISAWSNSREKLSRSSEISNSVAETGPSVRDTAYWDFNQPSIPAEIVSYQKGLNWSPKGGLENGGCLVSADRMFAAIIRVPIKKVPMRLSCWVAPVKRKGKGEPHLPFLMVRWNGPNANRVSFGSIRERVDGIPLGTWKRFEANIIGHAIECRLDGKRLFLEVYETVEETLCLGGVFCRIDDLRIEAIPADEIPDLSAYLDALDAIPTGQRKGKVSLAKFSPQRPLGHVYADFSLPTLKVHGYRIPQVPEGMSPLEYHRMMAREYPEVNFSNDKNYQKVIAKEKAAALKRNRNRGRSVKNLKSTSTGSNP